MPKIAVVQHPPVLLDRTATLERVVTLANEAVDGGADVIVFPEAYVPGYPTWIWRLRPGGDMGVSEKLHGELIANSVDLAAGDLDEVRRVAEERAVHILCGINERDHDMSRTTLYNTYVHIGPNGKIGNRHRKLMPTNPERMVWGFGDASGLQVADTPCGRVGVLICWENYMPLARYALYSQGLEVLVAPTWDCGEGWVGTMQYIGREGRCWVVGSGTSMRGSDVPEGLYERERLFPDEDEWINSGDSVVVEPGGKIVAGPKHREHGILYVEIDPAKVAAARRSLDVAGHYARPDVFQLVVRNDSQMPFSLE